MPNLVPIIVPLLVFATLVAHENGVEEGTILGYERPPS